MRFQKIPEDVQYIIASFLQPYEFFQYRQLSKDSEKIITRFLQRTKHTTQLELLVCPMCNDWISTDDISLFFFDLDINIDLHYQEIFNRLLFVEYCDVNRINQKHLFCDTCELKCTKLNYLPDFKKNRYYRLCFDYNNSYPWICIILEKGENVYWNQYSVIDNDIYEIDEDEMFSYRERFRYED